MRSRTSPCLYPCRAHAHAGIHIHTGNAKDAITGGLSFYLGMNADDLKERELDAKAFQSIQREFDEHGTEEDKECLNYILYQKAGSSDKMFPNGIRDKGRRGEQLIHFLNSDRSQVCFLQMQHVLALRLYTSAAFKSLNQPLRERAAADAKAAAKVAAAAAAKVQSDEKPQKMKSRGGLEITRPDEVCPCSRAGDPPVKSGWQQKRGHLNKAWKDRYFVRVTPIAPRPCPYPSQSQYPS